MNVVVLHTLLCYPPPPKAKSVTFSALLDLHVMISSSTDIYQSCQFQGMVGPSGSYAIGGNKVLLDMGGLANTQQRCD